MRPPGPIGASPRRPPPAAACRPPPGSSSCLRHSRSLCAAATTTASPAATATGWVRSPEVKPLRPPPLAAAPPLSLPGPRASLAPPLCAPAPPPAPPRHLPSRPPRAAALGLRPSPRGHSGARPLRTCVCLTAPFSTLAGPLPVSLCPSGSVEDKRSGSPGTVRFYPGTSVDVHRGDVFPHPFSASPDFLETPAAPPPLHRPLPLPRRSPPHGEGCLERRVCPGPEGGPAQLCPSPPSPLLLPAHGNPEDGGSSLRTRLPSLGKRRDTHLEGDWDLGVVGGMLAWVGWGLWRKGPPPLPRRPVLFLTPKEKCKPGGRTTPRRAGGTPPAGGRTAEGARESLPRPSSPPCSVLPSRRLIVPRPPLQ